MPAAKKEIFIYNDGNVYYAGGDASAYSSSSYYAMNIPGNFADQVDGIMTTDGVANAGTSITFTGVRGIDNGESELTVTAMEEGIDIQNNGWIGAINQQSSTNTAGTSKLDVTGIGDIKVKSTGSSYDAKGIGIYSAKNTDITQNTVNVGAKSLTVEAEGTAYAIHGSLAGRTTTVNIEGAVTVKGVGDKGKAYVTNLTSATPLGKATLTFGSVTSTSENSIAYGFHDAGSADADITLNGDMTVTGATYGIGFRLSGAADYDIKGKDGKEIDITVSSTSNDSQGTDVGNGSSSMAKLNLDVNNFTVSSTKAAAFGLYVEKSAGAAITGSVNYLSVTGGTGAYGIYTEGGSVSGTFGTISARGDSGAAYGIYNAGGTVSDTTFYAIFAESTNAEAYGVYAAKESTVNITGGEGSTISATAGQDGGGEAYAIYATGETDYTGAKVTVTAGTISASSYCFVYTVYADYGSSVTVTADSITATGREGAETYAITATGGDSTVSVDVNGGTISATEVDYGGDAYAIRAINNGNVTFVSAATLVGMIEICGGTASVTLASTALQSTTDKASLTFSGKWENQGTLTVDMTGATAREYVLADYTGTGSMTLADYGTVTLANNDAQYAVTVKDNDLVATTDVVASITDASTGKTAYYATLADAFDAVTADQTIKLLADVAETESATAKAVAFTIDLAGHTYSNTAEAGLVTVSGTRITLTDSTTPEAATAFGADITGAGSVVIDGNIALDGVTSAADITNAGTLTADGLTVNNSLASDGTLNLKDGKITVEDTSVKHTATEGDYTYNNAFWLKGDSTLTNATISETFAENNTWNRVRGVYVTGEGTEVDFVTEEGKTTTISFDRDKSRTRSQTGWSYGVALGDGSDNATITFSGAGDLNISGHQQGGGDDSSPYGWSLNGIRVNGENNKLTFANEGKTTITEGTVYGVNGVVNVGTTEFTDGTVLVNTYIDGGVGFSNNIGLYNSYGNINVTDGVDELTVFTEGAAYVAAPESGDVSEGAAAIYNASYDGGKITINAKKLNVLAVSGEDTTKEWTIGGTTVTGHTEYSEEKAKAVGEGKYSTTFGIKNEGADSIEIGADTVTNIHTRDFHKNSVAVGAVAYKDDSYIETNGSISILGDTTIVAEGQDGTYALYATDGNAITIGSEGKTVSITGDILASGSGITTGAEGEAKASTVTIAGSNNTINGNAAVADGAAVNLKNVAITGDVIENTTGTTYGAVKFTGTNTVDGAVTLHTDKSVTAAADSFSLTETGTDATDVIALNGNLSVSGEGSSVTLVGNTITITGNVSAAEGGIINFDTITVNGNITIGADSAITLADFGSQISFSGAWSNSGTLTVDMADATEATYKLVDYTGTTGSMTLADYGTVTLTSNAGYALKVQDNDMYAVKAVASITVGETTTYYASLGDALTAATSGQTVDLLVDVAESTFTLNDGITLDAHDYTITTTDGWTLNEGSVLKANSLTNGTDVTAMAKTGTVNGTIYASSGTLDLRGVDLRVKGEPAIFGGTAENPETLDTLKATRVFFGDIYDGGGNQIIKNIVLENCTTAYRAALGVYYDSLTVDTVSVNAEEGWYWDQQYQSYNYQMYTGFGGTLNINKSLTTGEYMNAGYSTGGTGITNLAAGATINCLDFQNTGNAASGITAEQAAQNIADGIVNVNGAEATLNAAALNNHAITTFGTVNLTSHPVHTTATGGLFNVNYGTDAVLTIGQLNFLNKKGDTTKSQMRAGDNAVTTIGGLSTNPEVGVDFYVTQESNTTINKDGGNAVQFTGDIVFTAYADATSAAKFILNLDSSDDYFTGAVRGTTSSSNRWGKWGSAVMGDEVAASDNITGMTLIVTNGAAWNMTGDSVVNTLTVTGSTLNGSDAALQVQTNGEFAFDYTSDVTVKAITNMGTITVDMTDATDAVYKLIDADATSDYGTYEFAAGKGAGYAFTVFENDLYAFKANLASEILVNSNYAAVYEGGDAIEGMEGYYYGINAFAELPADVSKVTKLEITGGVTNIGDSTMTFAEDAMLIVDNGATLNALNGGALENITSIAGQGTIILDKGATQNDVDALNAKKAVGAPVEIMRASVSDTDARNEENITTEGGKKYYNVITSEQEASPETVGTGDEKVITANINLTRQDDVDGIILKTDDGKELVVAGAVNNSDTAKDLILAKDNVSSLEINGDVSGFTNVELTNTGAGVDQAGIKTEVKSTIAAEGDLKITNAASEESKGTFVTELGIQTHTAKGDVTITNGTESKIIGKTAINEEGEEVEIAANIAADNDVTITNAGHLNAKVTAGGDLSITNTSANTLIGDYIGKQVNVTNNADAAAENVTLQAYGDEASSVAAVVKVIGEKGSMFTGDTVIVAGYNTTADKDITANGGMGSIKLDGENTFTGTLVMRYGAIGSSSGTSDSAVLNLVDVDVRTNNSIGSALTVYVSGESSLGQINGSAITIDGIINLKDGVSLGAGTNIISEEEYGYMNIEGNATLKGGAKITSSKYGQTDLSTVAGKTLTLTGDGTSLTVMKAFTNKGTIDLEAGASLNAYNGVTNTDATINLKGGTINGATVTGGTLNWVLDNSEYTASCLAWSVVTGATTKTITVDAVAEEENATYILASDAAAATGTTFTLQGVGETTTNITVDGDTVDYGNFTYALVLDGTDLKLTTVATGPAIYIDTEEKWFNMQDSTIIVEGTYTDPRAKGIQITVNGSTDGVVMDEVAKTWTYTYTGADTALTELTIAATEIAGDTPASDSRVYNLTVDRAVPEITIDATTAQYVDGDVNWYKMNGTATIAANGTDATSTLASMTKDGVAYTTGTADTLDITAEFSSAKTIAYTATDVAGNTSEAKTFVYNVDGTEPTINDVTYDNYQGDSKFMDGTGKIWFRQGDSTAKLSVGISDAGAGLKGASYNGAEYNADDGNFDLATIDEGDVSAIITAEDNVGNIAESENIAYAVDGTGPTINDVTDVNYQGDSKFVESTGKVWFRQGDTTAKLSVGISDAGAGLKDASYNGAQYNTVDGTFDLSTAAEGDVSDKITAEDNVGNSTESGNIGYTVDGTGPTINDVTAANYQGDSKFVESTGKVWFRQGDTTAKLSVVITDAGAGLKSASYNDVEYNVVEGTFVLSTATEGDVSAQISAGDNVGNSAESGNIGYTVDGTGPTINEVAYVNYQGDSKFMDGTGKVWFRQGDSTAKLSVGISDAGAGLKGASYNGAEYNADDGNFDLATTDEGDVSAKITAEDNVGNIAESENIEYAVDGTGPTVNISHTPTDIFTDTVSVTADISDGTGSGVKTQQYSFDQQAWYDYVDTFTVYENSRVYFRAVDNVGNITSKEYVISNIDVVAPELTIQADTTNIQQSVPFTVTVEDAYTNITSVEYSTDGGTEWSKAYEWSPSGGTEGSKTVTVDLTATECGTTYLFRATDQAGNTSEEQQVTFNNIYLGTEETFTVIGDLVVTPELPITCDNLVLEEGSSLQVQEDAVVDVKNTTLQGDTLIDNQGLAFEAEVLTVNGQNNRIDGELVDVKAVTFGEDAELGLDKDQYDLLMTFSDFASAGRLNVSRSVDNALRPQDVDILMKKANVDNVAFEQDLIDIRNLNFKETKSVTLSFRDGYGTPMGDTIRFRKETNVTLGSAGGAIDLEEGRNVVYIEKKANVTVLADFSKISTITTAAESVVTMADIDFADDRIAYLNAQGKTLHVGEINGSGKQNIFVLGKSIDFSSDDISTGDKADRITAAKDSQVGIGSIEYLEDGRVQFTGADLEFNGGNDVLNTQGKYFAAGNVDFGSGNDTLNIGKATSFFAAESWTLEWDNAADHEGTSADIVFGEGTDKLTTGKEAVLGAGNLTGIENISLGKDSITEVADIDGVRKLTIANGTDSDIASLTAGDVSATEKADAFNFGQFNEIYLDSLALGDGKDTLTLGKGTTATIKDLTFGDGKDTLTIGRDATLTVDTLDVDYLENLTMYKGATLVITDYDDFTAAQANDKWAKYKGQIVNSL